MQTNLYIDGNWVPSQSAQRFDVMNPATEDVIASVASADIFDADLALNAASIAMQEWAARSPRDRSEVLRKPWELMTARLPEFARLITLENGKANADAMGEANYAAEFFRWFAEEAVRVDRLAQLGAAVPRRDWAADVAAAQLAQPLPSVCQSALWKVSQSPPSHSSLGRRVVE